VAELLWLYDVAEARVAALADPAGLELDERLQESETLRFSVPADDPKADYIDNDRVVGYRSRRYRITELTAVRAGSSVRYDVAADALWIDLLGFPSIETNIVGATISQGLEAILADTNWTAGAVEGDGGNFSIDINLDGTALALLRAWAGMTDRELVFDTNGRTVELVIAQGADRGMGFRYGRNLISVTRKSEPPLATRLYATGGGDLDISGVHPDGLPYVDDFSYYTDQGLSLPAAQAAYLKVLRWSDERYLLALNLYDAAVAKLARLSQPTVSYELAVVDLADLTATNEQVELGDIVRVDDAPTGIELTTRVVRKVTRPLEPARTAVELSFLQPGIDTLSTGGTSSGGAAALSQLVSLNSSVLNVGGAAQIILNQIDLGVTPGDQANLIFGFELDATATGTGTLQIAFFYGGTPIGPTAQVPFVAGPVHVSVADFLVGLTTSNGFYAKASIVAGTGTVSIPANTAHLYVLGSGLAGGGASSSPDVVVAEAVVTVASGVVDAGATPALQTPIPVGPVEAVDTTPTVVASETVTATVAVMPVYRDSAVAVGTAVTSQNITVPATVVDGDLLLLAVSTPSAINHTTPAGWTIVSSDVGTGTNGVRQTVYKRTASGDASAVVACALSAASNVQVAVLAYLGANVVNVQGAGISSANGTTSTAPSVTTTVQWALCLDFYATVAASGSATITPPATVRVTHTNVALGQAVSEQLQAYPGATGTHAATQTSGSWVAQTIAIAP
jgi:phage minor structural protein